MEPWTTDLPDDKLNEDSEEKSYLPPGWKVHHSNRIPGRVYYYNIYTKVSTWESPKLISRSESLMIQAELSKSKDKVSSTSPYSKEVNSTTANHRQTKQSDINDYNNFFDGIDSENFASEPSGSWKQSFLKVSEVDNAQNSLICKQKIKFKGKLTDSYPGPKVGLILPSKRLSNDHFPEDTGPPLLNNPSFGLSKPLQKPRSIKDRLEIPYKRTAAKRSEKLTFDWVSSQCTPAHSLSSPTVASRQETLPRPNQFGDEQDSLVPKESESTSNTSGEELMTCNELYLRLTGQTSTIYKSQPQSVPQTTVPEPESVPQTTVPEPQSQPQTLVPEPESVLQRTVPRTGFIIDCVNDSDSVDDASVNPEKIMKSDKLQSIHSWLHQKDQQFPSTSDRESTTSGSINSADQMDTSTAALNIHKEPLLDFEMDEEVPMEVDEEDAQQVLTDIQEVRNALKDVGHKVVGSLTCLWNGEDKWQQTDNKTLFIILDTNVLMHHLNYIDELKDHPFEGFGRPTLVIPWVVFQELDLLKDGKTKGMNSAAARKAVKYLFDCFSEQNRRVVGQKPSDSSQLQKDMPIECNDDRILQCCLQWKDRYVNSEVLLFTNDFNLNNKAMVIGITSCSKKNISEKLKSLDGGFRRIKKVRSTGNQQNAVVRFRQISTASSSDQSNEADNLFCEIKELLRDPLSNILKSEMVKVFDKLWDTVVYRQPPWTTFDVLKCIQRHWMAVFGMILPRSLYKKVNYLVAELSPGKTPRLNQMQDIIDDLLALCEAFRTKLSILDDEIRNLIILRKRCRELVLKGSGKRTVVDGTMKHSDHSAQASSSTGGASCVPSFNMNEAPHVTQGGYKAPKVQRLQHKSVRRETVYQKPNKVKSPSANAYKLSEPNVRECTPIKHNSTTANESRSNASSNHASNPKPSASTTEATAVSPSIAKFQSVWSSIHSFIEHIKSCVLQSQHINPQLMSSLQVVRRFVLDIKGWYTKLLRVNPACIHQNTRVFINVCSALNKYPFSSPQSREVSLTVSQLKTFFQENESRNVLEFGYAQLCQFERDIENYLAIINEQRQH